MHSSNLVKHVVVSIFCVLLTVSFDVNSSTGVQIQYMSNPEFIEYAFPNSKPENKLLILNADLRKKAADILSHSYRGRRIRYWIDGNRTSWILDEIGKELPITMGIVIENKEVKEIKVLVYREERGGEVHEKFFMDQFVGAILQEDHSINKEIDGITGATLSVNAVTRVAALALMLDQYVTQQ